MSRNATELIARHFDDVPFRPAPVRPSFDEPWLTSAREAEHIDQHAPAPALAVGWRLPDPVADLHGYLAFVVLAGMLTDGESARLQSTVVAKASSGHRHLGQPGIARRAAGLPRSRRLRARRHPSRSTCRPTAVIDAANEQIAILAAEGPDEPEMRRALARFTSALYRDNDGVASRTRSLGAMELLHGRAELLSELPDLLSRGDRRAGGRRRPLARSGALCGTPDRAGRIRRPTQEPSQ